MDGALDFAVVVVVDPIALLAAFGILAFDELFAVGIELAVEAVGDVAVVTVAGDLPLVAEFAVGVLIAVDALSTSEAGGGTSAWSRNSGGPV